MCSGFIVRIFPKLSRCWPNMAFWDSAEVGIVQTPPRSAEVGRYFVKRSRLDPKREKKYVCFLPCPKKVPPVWAVSTLDPPSKRRVTKTERVTKRMPMSLSRLWGTLVVGVHATTKVGLKPDRSLKSLLMRKKLLRFYEVWATSIGMRCKIVCRMRLDLHVIRIKL